MAVPGFAQLPPISATQPSASAPSALPAPAGVEYQPHVYIDWPELTVRVDGRIVSCSAPLEFLAAYAGREHESLIRLSGDPLALYQALGLIGLSEASDRDPTQIRPSCAETDAGLADVLIEWLDGGQVRAVEPFAWLRDIEFGRRPPPVPWRFIGPLKHDSQARAAVQAGDAVGLVSKEDNILAPLHERSDAEADLWVTADLSVVPPEGTPVRLLMRAARPRTTEIQIDYRGALRLNGAAATTDSVVDAAVAATLLRPNEELVIDAARALRADVRRLKRTLLKAGVPERCISFLGKRAAPENPPVDRTPQP